MTLLEKLKLSAGKKTRVAVSTEESLRARLYDHLTLQKELIDAEAKGEKLVKTRTTYVANDAGERVAKNTERKLRKWYWHDADGVWFLELRYGGKVIKIAGENTAIEVGAFKNIGKVITTVMQAVQAGELDKALLAAKKERMTILRRNRKAK